MREIGIFSYPRYALTARVVNDLTVTFVRGGVSDVLDDATVVRDHSVLKIVVEFEIGEYKIAKFQDAITKYLFLTGALRK